MAEQRLNPTQLTEAREWLKEIIHTFRDIEEESEIDQKSDEQVEKAIEKHFSGGVTAFLETFN